MQADLSITSLILQASWLVKFVMLILLGASVGSWTLIFSKRNAMNFARRAAKQFEDRFWSSDDLTALYKKISASRADARGMEHIFESGFKEFGRFLDRLLALDELVEHDRRWHARAHLP